MNSHSKGISIVEVLVATAIIGITVVGIVTAFNMFLVLSIKNTNNVQAALLVEESMEVVQYVRDGGWASNIASLSVDTDYYILWNGLDYSITSSPQLEKNKFTRKLVFRAINRDSGDNITESGGAVDDGTRKVEVDISWNDAGETENINSEFLIHDVYQN